MRYDAAKIRALLTRLEREPADALESETLEFKLWKPNVDPKEQFPDLRVSVVCFANANGGTIVLGVKDRVRTRKDAITGVGDLNPDRLRQAVYDGTDPHVLVEVEEMVEPEGRILLVHVPRGLGIHTTSEGVAKVRVGKDCKPLTGSMMAGVMASKGALDLTAQPLPTATLDELDPAQIGELQKQLATEGRKPELGRQAAGEVLENLGLVRRGEPTLAAVLLLGRSAALARWAPQHEVIFVRYEGTTPDLRHNLKGPIFLLLDRLHGLLDASLRITPVQADLFREIVAPDLTWWAAREAVLNAIVHRDYFVRQSIYVELRAGRVEISSPGGFIGGVAPDNILRHHPVRRNPLLAEALEAAGLVNRAGMGVDRIYEELLRTGKGLPRYEADESSVRLVLPTKTNESFARFVAEETVQRRGLGLDELILLRAITERGHLDRWSAAKYLQMPDDAASERLVALRQRGYLVPRGRGQGTTYHLNRALSDRLRGRLATDDEALGIDDEAVRLRVLAVLAERGTLTNTELRRLAGYSRGEVSRLMRALREEGMVELKGEKRGAHYVPGPNLPPPVGGKRKRRVQRS